MWCVHLVEPLAGGGSDGLGVSEVHLMLVGHLQRLRASEDLDAVIICEGYVFIIVHVWLGLVLVLGAGRSRPTPLTLWGGCIDATIIIIYF